MKSRFTWVVLGFLLLAAGCGNQGKKEGDQTETSALQTAPARQPLPELADQVVKALAEKDWETLTRFVHPEKGVRFTPYGYLTPDQVVFSREQIAGLPGDTTVYRWGNYDGSGKPIELTFAEYYRRFIYNKAYLEGQKGDINQRLGSGNSLNNISEFYRGREVAFVEYYLPGSEQYGGMDWGSLRLVFEKSAQSWYLIAIVHDAWTI